MSPPGGTPATASAPTPTVPPGESGTTAEAGRVMNPPNEKSPDRSCHSSQGNGNYLGAGAGIKTRASVAPATDMASLDALLVSEASIYAAGYRAGHAAGVLESDRRVSDSVRHMLADLREGRLL